MNEITRDSRYRNGREPKHQIVRNLLRKQIQTGKYRRGTRLPPETELVKQLGASNTTVRHALRDLIREGLIVRRRGSGTYVSDPQRPPLIRGRHLRLGLLWGDPVGAQLAPHGMASAMTRGALRAWGMEEIESQSKGIPGLPDMRMSWESSERGASVVALGEAKDWPDRAPRMEWVEQEGLDGALCFSIISEIWIERLLNLGIPVVLVDYPNDRFSRRVDQVYADPLPGYRAAVRHFVDQGLRRIHYLSSSTRVPSPDLDMSIDEWKAYAKGKWFEDPDNPIREMAYRQAMSECGLKVSENWIHRGRPKDTVCREIGERLVRLDEPQRPEALVCHSLSYGENLREPFVERSIPLQVAGATYLLSDSDELAIHMDAEEIGLVAAELLLSRLQRPHHRALRVAVEMVFRPTAQAETNGGE